MKPPITQKHEFGCGAACVAFVSGKSYSKAVSTLRKAKASSGGFLCKDLVKVLAKFGFSYEYKYLKPKLKRKIYKDDVIVFIKRSKKYPSGHYLARHDGQWMDPWINFDKEHDLSYTKSGFRKYLPGKPIYALFPDEF